MTKKGNKKARRKNNLIQQNDLFIKKLKDKLIKKYVHVVQKYVLF